MSWKFNPFSGSLDYYENNFRGVLSSAPSGNDGNTYINSSDNGYYIYYGGAWQLIATLTPAASSKMLLETGDRILLETGDFALLES